MKKTATGIFVLGAVLAALLACPGGLRAGEHGKSPGSGSKGEHKPIPPPVLPDRTDFSKRVGIVYSDTTAKGFYNKFAYSQLFMAMQHQAMMAGIPFDLLTENDLTNLANLVNYDALIFPSALNVRESKWPAIAGVLREAVYHYHIGIIAAGDFFTLTEKNEPAEGKPYWLIRQLLGLQKIADVQSLPMVATAEAVDHPVMRDYTAGEVIYTSGRNSIVAYTGVPGQPFAVLAEVKAGHKTYPGVVATETGGRNVFFGDTQLIGVCNLVWPALQWVVFGDQPAVGIKLTRSKSLFGARNDMDQSRYPREIARVEVPLLELLRTWKTRYNFVGSYFLNVGNKPAAGESTDWAVSGPLYQNYLALGNEIGTHTWTHPQNVNLLSRSQLEFEFNQSKREIETHLGIKVHGAAIPGEDEKLSVDNQLERHGFDYISGRYSNAGAGYPGAFGFLTPRLDTLYFCHSFQSDFFLVQFRRMPGALAKAEWAREYAGVMRHAAQPIVHLMWHDYGPLASPAFGYTLDMYQDTLEMAFNDQTEFATMLDIQNRIRAWRKARILVTEGDALTVTVEGTGLGQLPLRIGGGKSIEAVDGWYAYNDDSVFLPRDGGTFVIHRGASAAPRTHIVSLPMRANLLSLSGNDRDLSFTFEGEGQVGIAMNAGPGEVIQQTGADGAQLSGNLLMLRFETAGLHAVQVTIQ